MKNTMKDVKYASMFSQANKMKVEDAIEAAIQWLNLDSNLQLAKTNDIKDKMKELERICIPIFAPIHRGAARATGSYSGSGR